MALKMRSAALTAVKLAAAGSDRLRRPPRGVVVLIYHRVGALTSVEVDLPSDLFDAQMEELAASGRVVSLDDALEVLASPTLPASDPIVVTFDDGTADFADIAVPILARHRVPATLYVATDFVERGQSFPDDGAPASWQGLADSVATGLITIGSHTHTHALLDRLPPAAVDEELTRSIDLIGERLGVEAAHFAYPKAVAGSPEAEAIVRRLFRSAAVGGNRPNPYGATDPYRIQRSAIQKADGMRWFRRKTEGGMAVEDAIRRRLNQRRYVGQTS